MGIIFLGATIQPTGEGNGTPLQYSCLGNPMDGGAWQAAIHGVSKSRTRLRDFTFTFMHWRRKWQPIPVFLPGESQGQGSLVGCHLWGRTESDTIKVTQQQQQHSTHYILLKDTIFFFLSFTSGSFEEIQEICSFFITLALKTVPSHCALLWKIQSTPLFQLFFFFFLIPSSLGK